MLYSSFFLLLEYYAVLGKKQERRKEKKIDSNQAKEIGKAKDEFRREAMYSLFCSIPIYFK